MQSPSETESTSHKGTESADCRTEQDELEQLMESAAASQPSTQTHSMLSRNFSAEAEDAFQASQIVQQVNGFLGMAALMLAGSASYYLTEIQGAHPQHEDVPKYLCRFVQALCPP